MRKIILTLAVFLFFQNFSGQIGNKPVVEVLNMADGFSRPKEVRLSTFLKNLKYIPLETNPDALISESAKFEVTNEYVIVRQLGSRRMYQILLFDRNNGRFLRGDREQGRGPGEYAIFSPLPYNPVKKEFYAIDPSRDILVYDIMGNNIDRIKMPGFKNPEANDELNSGVLVTFNSILDGNIFVGYVVNNSGIEKEKAYSAFKGWNS